MVTADSLFYNKTMKASEKISAAIMELRAEGLITIKSVLNHGMFMTELIPAEGYVQHESIKGILRKEDENYSDKDIKPKRKYQKRKVKRGLI